jgi:hypothetical protein
MLIWVVAVVLVGGFGLLGHQTGAIRWGIGFIGAALGLALAGIAGGPVSAGLAMMGVKDYVDLALLPGVIIFSLLTIIFLVIGVAAHRPVELYFKYRSDEPTRAAFERMNQAIGLFVGLISGICVLFSVGNFVYRQGYLITQVTSENGEATPVRYIAQLRSEMESTGWARTFAAMDNSPAKYYEVSDILGILHANPLVQGRAENYPPFLALGAQQEFAEIGSDAEFLKLIQSKPALSDMLNHPKAAAVLFSPTLRETFSKVDLKDFRKYLETGVSPRYEDEKILGRWRMDPGTVFTQLKRERLNLSPAEMRSIRTALGPILSGATLVAYTDGRFSIKIAPPAAPVAAANPEGGDPSTANPAAAQNAYMARYGLRPSSAGTQATPNPQPKAAKVAKLPPGIDFIQGLKSFDGTWTRTDGRYVLGADVEGSKQTLDALVNETGRLTWSFGSGDKKFTVYFVRTS